LLLGSQATIAEVLYILILSLVAGSVQFTLSATGELALGQVGVFAAGGYTAAVLTSHYHWNFWLALPLAVVASSLVGLVAASPSLRVGSWSFALTNIFIAVVIVDIVTQLTSITGGADGIAGIPRPSVFGHALTQNDLYVLTLFALLTFLLVSRLLASSTWGYAFSSLQRSAVLADSLGVPRLRVKIVAYTFASAVAGLAGALFSAIDGYISPSAFPLSLSILLVAAMVIGGIETLLGPVVGVIIFQTLPHLTTVVNRYSLLIYGVLLVVVMLVIPEGVVPTVVGAYEHVWARLRIALLGGRRTREAPDRLKSDATGDLSPDGQAEELPTTPAISGVPPPAVFGDLYVEDVSKVFYGVPALRGVSLRARSGAVTAVIGPNGSGKTTLLNVICRFYRVDGGRVRIAERVDVPGGGSASVGRIGRTFQTPIVMGKRSVLDNVMAGAFVSRRATFAESLLHVGRARSDERRARDTAERLLEVVLLRDLGDRAVEGLTLAQQRRLEVARALAMRPTALLLDEPCAGLAGSDVDDFATVLDWVRDAGYAVILVEHNVDLVMQMADEINVLDAGQLIASGAPDDVQNDENVVASYLGAQIDA